MRRTRIPLAALLLLALTAGACGGGKATPLATVRAAASKTASAKTALMTMTIEGGQGALANQRLDGGFDFEADRAVVNIDASKVGIPGVTGNIVTLIDFKDGVVEYLHIPQLASEANGKSWMKIDLGRAMKSICPDIDFGALLRSQSGDPYSGLRLLAGAKTVTSFGTEQIRSETTTHYHAVVNLDDVVANTPEDARATMRQLAGMYGTKDQESDVWIDGDGRVRKYSQSIDMSTLHLPACMSAAAAANPFKGTVTYSYEMYDFGKEVNTTLPADRDVVDVQDLAHA